MALGAAWNLLATDRPVDALHEFGRQARSNPDNGMPKATDRSSGCSHSNARIGRFAVRVVEVLRAQVRVERDRCHRSDAEHGFERLERERGRAVAHPVGPIGVSRK